MTSLFEQQQVSRFKILRRIKYFFDKHDPILLIIVVIIVIFIITMISLLIFTNVIEKFSNNKTSSSLENAISITTNDKKVSDEFVVKITNEITPVLNNYKHLDVPIIINNTGKTCGNWSKYMDG